MLREEVARHYRAKGYTIRERVQVRGRSGTVHAIEMVAQGPLGNLVIAFEDEGGFEVAELHSVRRWARDIGATPVVALDRIPDSLRRKATELGVVLLDGDAMHAEPIQSVQTDELEQEPWPDPDGRAARAGKSTDPGFWRYPRLGDQSTTPGRPVGSAPSTTPQYPTGTSDPAGHRPPSDHAGAAGRPASSGRPGMSRRTTGGSSGFAWLPPAEAPTPRPSTARTAPARVPSKAPAPVQVRFAWWQWASAAAIFGGAAGGVFYALLRILG